MAISTFGIIINSARGPKIIEISASGQSAASKTAGGARVEVHKRYDEHGFETPDMSLHNLQNDLTRYDSANYQSSQKSAKSADQTGLVFERVIKSS